MTSGDADAMSWLTENVSPLPGHGGMGTEDGFEAESVRPRSFTPLTALRARALREQLDDGRMVSAAGASPPSTLLQQDINRLQTAFRSSLQGEGFKTPAKASGAMDRALEVVSAVENVARHVSGSERTPSYVHRTRDRQLRDMGLKKEALDLPAEPFDAWLRRADPASIIGPAARRELGKLWEAADENKRLRRTIENILESEMEIARAEEEEVAQRLQLLMDEGARLEEAHDALERELEATRAQLGEADALRTSEAARAVQEAERARALADDLLSLGRAAEEQRDRYEDEVARLQAELEAAGRRLAEAESAAANEEPGCEDADTEGMAGEEGGLGRARLDFASLQGRLRSLEDVARAAEDEKARVQLQLAHALERLAAVDPGASPLRADAGTSVDDLRSALRQRQLEVAAVQVGTMDPTSVGRLRGALRQRENADLQRELRELKAELEARGVTVSPGPSAAAALDLSGADLAPRSLEGRMEVELLRKEAQTLQEENFNLKRQMALLFVQDPELMSQRERALAEELEGVRAECQRMADHVEELKAAGPAPPSPMDADPHAMEDGTPGSHRAAEEVIADLEEQIQALKQQNEDLMFDLRRAGDTADAAEVRVAELEERMAGLEDAAAAAAELRAQLHVLEERVQVLIGEGAWLEGEMGSLRAENAQLAQFRGEAEAQLALVRQANVDLTAECTAAQAALHEAQITAGTQLEGQAQLQMRRAELEAERGQLVALTEEALRKLEGRDEIIQELKVLCEERQAALEAAQGQQSAHQSALEHRAADLEAALGDARVSYAKLEAALHNERAAAALHAQQSAELQQERDALSARASDLARQRDSLAQQASQVQEEQSVLRRNAARLERERDALHERAAKLEQERDALSRHAANLLEERAAAVSPLTSQLQQERDALLENATLLQCERDSVSAQASQLQQERDTLSQQAAKLQQERDTLSQQAAKLQQERDTLSHQAAKLQQERDTLSRQASQLQQERDMLSQRTDHLENGASSAAAALEGQLSSLRSDLDVATRTAAEAIGRADALQSQLRERERLAAHFQAQAEEAGRKVAALESHLGQERAQRERDVDRERNRVVEVEAELRGLRDTLQTLRHENATINAQLTDATDARRTAESSFRARERQLADELAAVRTEAAHLKGLAAAATAATKDSSDAAGAATSRIRQLEEVLAQLYEEKGRLEGQVRAAADKATYTEAAVATAAQRSAAAEAETRSLASQLQDAQLHLQQATRELEAARAASGRTAQLEAETRELRGQLQEALHAAASTRAALDQECAARQESQMAQAQMEGQLAGLRQRLASLEAAWAPRERHLMEEGALLTQRNAALTAELQQMHRHLVEATARAAPEAVAPAVSAREVQLEAEVAAFRRQLAVAVAAREDAERAAEARLTQLQQALGRAQKAAAESQAQAVKLQEESRGAAEDLQEGLLEAQTEASRLKKRLAVAEQSLAAESAAREQADTAARQRETELQSELTRARRQLAASKVRLAELETEAGAAASADHAASTTHLAVPAAQHHALKMELLEAQATATEAQEDAARAVAREMRLQQEVTRLSRQAAAAAAIASVAARDETVALMTQRQAALARDLAEVRRQLHTAEGQLAEARAGEEGARAAEQALSEANGRLRAQLSETLAIASASGVAEPAPAAVSSALQHEVLQLKRRVSELTVQLAAAQEEVQVTAALQRARMQQEKVQLERELARSKKDVEELTELAFARTEESVRAASSTAKPSTASASASAQQDGKAAVYRSALEDIQKSINKAFGLNVQLPGAVPSISSRIAAALQDDDNDTGNATISPSTARDATPSVPMAKLLQEAATLRSQLDAAQTRTAEQERTLAALTSERDDLMERVAAAERTAAAAVHDLEGRVHRLQAENAELNAMTSAAIGRLEAREAELAETRVLSEDLQKRLDRATAQTSKDGHEVQRERDELRSKLRLADARIKALEAEAKEVQLEYDAAAESMERSVAAAKGRTEEVHGELSTVRRELQSQTDRFKELQDKVAAAQEAADAMRGRVRETEGRLNAVSLELEALREEKRAWGSKRQEFESMLGEARRIAQAAQTEVRRRDEQLSTLADKAPRQIGALRDELDTAKKGKAAAESQLTRVSDLLAAERQLTKSLEEECAALNRIAKERAAVDKDRARLEAELGDLRRSARKTEIQRQELASEVEKLRPLQARLQELERDLARYQDARGTVDDRVRSLERDLSDTRAQLQTAEEGKHEVMHDLRAALAHCEQSQRRATELEASEAELRRQVAELKRAGVQARGADAAARDAARLAADVHRLSAENLQLRDACGKLQRSVEEKRADIGKLQKSLMRAQVVMDESDAVVGAKRRESSKLWNILGHLHDQGLLGQADLSPASLKTLAIPSGNENRPPPRAAPEQPRLMAPPAKPISIFRYSSAANVPKPQQKQKGVKEEIASSSPTSGVAVSGGSSSQGSLISAEWRQGLEQQLADLEPPSASASPSPATIATPDVYGGARGFRAGPNFAGFPVLKDGANTLLPVRDLFTPEPDSDGRGGSRSPTPLARALGARDAGDLASEDRELLRKARALGVRVTPYFLAK